MTQGAEPEESFMQQAGQRLRWPVLLVVLIWIIQGFQYLLNGQLGALGIYPHHISGLKGIVFAPLIHGSWGHLISNTVPLFVLTLILAVFYRRIAFISFVLIYLGTGLAVWLFARPVYHIGASGVVYGLLSFIFWSGVFRRNIRSIVLALIVTILYSGFIWGVLPLKEGISWESHLYGAVVGILVAFLFRHAKDPDEEMRYSYEEEPDQEKRYFYNRDTFDHH
ncbi:MAG TPA: rhomboid family intramembrane serine protease [Saprospiraceae bacterium]|nr:rhomboid family intramembrane serine protease [Saprospiraceae bacterium]MCB9270962.1 rhomboid family intramembrane serine protease [Lewinellaceae bacterium]HPG08155.1 rhomboid family intramembrane serine protease [Saprospiraceae bacterium]HQU52357.1 rhomboid family intramembrane serine protease [Saprospiraceae bacterium]HRV84535.1 rhomboid family intramembrane serine protease [Saprospiraceae bacterium]